MGDENMKVEEQLENLAAEETEMEMNCPRKKSHCGFGIGLIAVGAVAAIAAVVAKKRKKNDDETIEKENCEDEDIEVEDLDEPFEAMAEATGLSLEDEKSEEK